MKNSVVTIIVFCLIFIVLVSMAFIYSEVTGVNAYDTFKSSDTLIDTKDNNKDSYSSESKVTNEAIENSLNNTKNINEKENINTELENNNILNEHIDRDTKDSIDTKVENNLNDITNSDNKANIDQETENKEVSNNPQSTEEKNNVPTENIQ